MKSINNFIIYIFFVLILICSCNQNPELTVTQPANIETPANMVWITGNAFTQGAKDNDNLAIEHEKPAHPVEVDGFFMDITEVTNAQFKKFVQETGYQTIAERPIDWEEMKKSLPEGTEKPCDTVLVPGSLVFKKNVKTVENYNNYGQWWTFQSGVNWKHPQGKGSNIDGKDNYPVVHIAYLDAMAYCKWANRRLPTEAEWELAAQGNTKNAVYAWGNNKTDLIKKANTWQGKFPVDNQPLDGFEYIAPVKSFASNGFGLYDMAGNVWEFTQDWYNIDYYNELLATQKPTRNPQGANKANNPNNPYQNERIIKGGSFLCNESYCSSYRISARMGMTEDSSSDHVGFRTVATVKMLLKK